MTNMKLFLELIAKSSGFRNELDGSGRAVTKFTRGAKREIGELRNAFGSLQSKVAGLGLSIGAVAIAMESARLDKSLTQIGQTAGEGRKQVVALRQDLFRMAKDSGQGIEDLKGGFDALVQSGLNMKESKATLDGINVAMAVTGANSQTLAGGLAVAAKAFDFDLAKPGQALELLDKMTVAGRLGNAELQNLSDIFSRVGVNAKSAGMGFDKTLAFIEGLSQVERQPERLGTLADSTLRVFTNANYMKSAQKATGIRFFDSGGSRRDALAVLTDIKKKYDTLSTDQQRFSFISKAFGKADLDTIKGLKTLLSGKSLNEIAGFSQKIADAGGALKKDLPEAISNAVDQTGRLKNTLREAADKFVQPINKAIADLIKLGLNGKDKGGMGLDGKDIIVDGAGIGLAALLAGRYGKKALGGALGRFLKGAGSVATGVAEGKLLEAAAGVTPVFVTNWPGGGLPGMPGSGDYSVFKSPSYTKGSTVAGNAVKALPWAVIAGGTTALLAAAAVGVPISMNISDKVRENGWSSRTFNRSDREYEVMGIGGGRQLKNDIMINIAIDGHDRITTSTNGMNNSVNTMKRGSFFDAITAVPAVY